MLFTVFSSLLQPLTSAAAYSMSKMGMTMAAIGIAQEMKGKGVAANSIWPVTLIESAATKNHQIGGPKQWRKADILVDAIMAICESDPNELTGQQLMDEDFLRSKVQLNIVKHSSCSHACTGCYRFCKVSLCA